MSYPPPPPAPLPNPYASPLPATPIADFPVNVSQSRMEYMRAYQYIFDNPNWVQTILYLGLLYIAAAIPMVGMVIQVLYLGFQFEIIEWLLKTQGRQYPTFDFNRFGDYLGRGIWPFLANLVASFVLLPIIYIGMGIGILAVGSVISAAGEDAGPAIGIALGSVIFVVLMAGMFLAMFLMVGMILRAGLSQDFASAFQFNWIMDFCKRMWLEMLLSGLFLMATGFALSVLGLLALCVGLLFTMPLVLLASAHILYQLYVVYLSRGGMPVPIKMTAQPLMPPA
jgi:hypothetical protein